MTTPREDERLAYSLEQAAQLTAVSVKTIQRAVAAGDLAVKYPTSRPVIPAGELREWFAALPSTPPSK